MKRKNISVLLCGAIALLGMSACSDDMNEPNGTKDNAGQALVYKLNVAATTRNEGTKALTLDEKSHIHTAWKPGDKMFVYNCSDNNKSTEKQYSTVVTQDDGGTTASFTGSIKSKNAMQESDVLGFFYPGAAIEQQDNVAAGELTQEQVKVNGSTQVIDYYKNSEAVKDQVLLNLSQQDGTLETINKKYDYCWGKTSPAGITGDATNGYTCRAKVDLHRMVAFWGLQFNGGKEGTPLTSIEQININGPKSTDVLNLKDGKLIGNDQNKDFSINISNNGNYIKLTNGFIWVALLPGETHRVTITLKTTDGKVYSKSVNKTFKENTTYRSRITNMNEVTAEPYVEVCGTKWATGNFIRYVDPENPSNVYWGVAPAQWWISHYCENPTEANYLPAAGGKKTPILAKDLGSQHWYTAKPVDPNGNGEWGITQNNLDLFTWGAIKEVLNFPLTGNYLANAGLSVLSWPKEDRGNLSKKWFEKSNYWTSPTTDPTKANYGDIVWYYTYDASHNHHYRYPTLDEMKALQYAKTIVPAYCYTDKGNKVYGAYFSDADALSSSSGAKDIKAFPTGRNNLWKYENVTGLVLANKGLFLPITGFRSARATQVVYRYVDNVSTFYSAYLTSQETAVSTINAFFFGSNEWNPTGTPQKQQGNPIRPVWDSGNETAPIDASKFAPFNKIVTTFGARKY